MHSGEHGILAKTVIPFLKHLAEHGIVRIHMRPKSTWEIDAVEVLTDIETAAKAGEQRAERVRAEQERRAAHDARLADLRTKFEARRHEQGQPEQQPASAQAHTTSTAGARGHPWLYEPLPDFHAALGFLSHHLGQHAYQGWHNDVFRACIYQQPPGQALTLDEIYKTARLDENLLPPQAVRAFLTHVVTARHLDVAEQADTWTVTNPD